MTLGRFEVFGSSAPGADPDALHHPFIIGSIYSATSMLSLDIFEDRYSIFLLPLSFTSQSKETLQIGLESLSFGSRTEEESKDFLVSLFNFYASRHGTPATLEMLDWIKNASENAAKSLERYLTGLHYDYEKNKLKTPPPPRIERYFAFRELLRANYLATINNQELAPDFFESAWDKKLYEKYFCDDFGTRANFFDPSLTSNTYGNVLFAKVAWENACQGKRPDAEELKLLGDWIVDNTRVLSADDYEDPSALYLSPILRNEYVRRKIVRE